MVLDPLLEDYNAVFSNIIRNFALENKLPYHDYRKKNRTKATIGRRQL